jgi:hypothetical protein
MRNPLIKTSIIIAVAGFIGLQSFVKPSPHHAKSSNIKKGGWVSLFDGKSLKGWHNFNSKSEVKNWTIIDGALVCLGATADAKGGDLVTDKQYTNFELSWSWKIETGSNSGVMYHVVEDPKYHTTYETGPEYQIIDDNGWPDKLEEWQKTGCDYAMHLPNDQKKLMPVGEWNTSKIIFNNGYVEHWLNGKKILEFEAWSDDWNKKKAAGKWKDYPDYGLAKTGHLSLQDHGHKAYFKDIKIKEFGD